MAVAATALPGQRTVSAFEVFRNRNFRLLWSGELVSTIGDALMSLAASLLIYRLTGSALSVGLMLIATAAPSLVLGLIAGVFVDRFDRKWIMVAADLARAVLVLSIPFLVRDNIAWLYIIVLLTSCVGQFFEPAHASVVPEVASDEELAAANSMIAISSFGSTAIGFAASGLIASAFSIDWAFYLDALTFVFSALCISLLRLPAFKAEGSTNVSTIINNMQAGFRFLFNSPVLRSTFILFPLINLSFGLWNTLLLPFARSQLHATEFEYGLQEGLTSIGFVIGSLVMARLADRLHEGQWLTLSFLTMGIVGAVYSTLSSIPIAIGLVMVSGFFNAPSAIARQLIIQRNTTRQVRGRVNSAYFVTRSFAFIVGMGAAGLADSVGVRQMVLLSSLMVLIPGALALFLPGLGQPAAEWRRALHLLRTAPAAPPHPRATRPATLADLDSLAIHLPALTGLTAQDRRTLTAHSYVMEVPAGATIVRRGEAGESAYFILSGQALAGLENPDGSYRSLEKMNAGDFFGEIAALTHAARTADVVALEPTTLLEVPADTFRQLVADSALGRLIRRKFGERTTRTSLSDLPRFTGIDPQTARELRTEQPAAEPAPA